MKNKLVVLFFIGIILAPLKCNAVVYYDDAKSYSVNSDEIVSTLNKFKFEQSNLNSTIVGGKVIDLVIFAGQSNMVGKSIKDDVLFEVPNRSGFELRFNSDNKAVGVKYLKDSIDLDTSLIPAFANAYYNNTGVPIVAVQAAISGSKIEDWQKGKKYYNIMKVS